MSTFEVEIKFRVSNLAELERRLQQRFGNSEFGASVTETDCFFQHPCRDFAQTDECLRLRKRTFAEGASPNAASEYYLTYKGPKIDPLTKTRQETEVLITEPERWENLLTALGFRKSASLCKLRRRLALTAGHRHIEITLDTLPDLPESARLFLEMETLATGEEVEECRSLILGLAGELGLSEPIRDSYLKLVQNR